MLTASHIGIQRAARSTSHFGRTLGNPLARLLAARVCLLLDTVLLVLAGFADRCSFQSQGDVIGCLLFMPEGGRTFEKDKSVRAPLCHLSRTQLC